MWRVVSSGHLTGYSGTQRGALRSVMHLSEQTLRELAGVSSCSSGRLPASSRILNLNTRPSRQQGMWKVSWTDYASRRISLQAIRYSEVS